MQTLPPSPLCRARTQGRPSLEVRLDPGLCQPSRSGCRQPGGLLWSRHPQSEPREGRGFPRSLWRANPGRSLHHVISENRNFRSIIWGQPAHAPPWAGSLGRMQSAEAPGPPSAVGVADAGRPPRGCQAMALLGLLWMWLLVAETHGAKDGDMRLADGDAANQGRVEIFYRGQWGTVCDNLWDLLDASVVCRALGFTNATEALGRAAFGPGSGPVMLDEVQCTGTEPSLANCSSLGWRRSRCRHSQDAGVICSNETRGVYTLDLSGEIPTALERIFDSQKGCDLTIRVKGKDSEDLSMCGHSLILSSNPEAQALWREPGSTVTLEADAECLPLVRDVVRYFYSRRIAVSPASVRCLHKLASAYGATRLQSYCALLFATLIPQDLSFRTALGLYTYALATRDPRLEAICLQFLAWNFEALTGAAAWPSVPPALLRVLLSRGDLAVPSELALLMALEAWSWEQHATHEEMEGLLGAVRFPMILPEDLFQLQFNLSLYRSHQALFQERTLQALEFHTVPVRLLARHGGPNLTDDAYRPRLYTAPAWSASVPRASGTSYYYRSEPSQSFQTPAHPSFLFQATPVYWTLSYLPTAQSCWSYGFSCSPDEVPALYLSKSGYSDGSIGYENKALMICGGGFVADVATFRGPKAIVPSALETNGSRSASLFPCPAGSFSSFRAVIRPFYLTNSSGVD